LLKHQWTSHRRLVVCAAVAAALALLVGVSHTPFVRAKALSWAVARLRTDAGLRVEIGQLDYNLATLSSTFHNVTITAEHSRTPFFYANVVQVNFPWAIVAGSIGVESLEIDRPRLVIVREEDGTFNLPQTTDAREDQTIDSIEIGRFAVRNLELSYSDRSQNVSVAGRNITLDLRPNGGPVIEGRLSAPDGVTIRAGDRSSRIARLDGSLAFNGSALAVRELALESPEGRVRFDGTVNLLNELKLTDLRYEGRLDLERVAPWLAAEPAPSGFLLFSGEANGAIDRLNATVDVAGDRLAWSSLGDISLRAHAILTGAMATVDTFEARIEGGTIAGTARIPLDKHSAGHAQLRWHDIGAGSVIAAVAPDSELRLASTSEGAAELDWSGSEILAGRGSIESRLRASSAPRRALAISGRAALRLDEGAWQLSHVHQLANAATLSGSASGRIDYDAPKASTLNGRATLHVARLNDALGQVRASGIDIDSDVLSRLSAVVSVDAVLAGTIGSPTATGVLDATDLRYGGTGPGNASARFAASAGGINVDPLQVAIGANTIAGHTTINFDRDTVTGELSADLPQIAELTADVPETWRPKGSAKANVRFSGALDNPTATAEVFSDGLIVAGQAFRRLKTTMRVANHVVSADTFELLQNEGRLIATGNYSLSGGRYTFEMSGDALAIVPLLPQARDATAIPLDARFDIRLSGQGTVDSPKAHGFVQFSRVSWEQYELGSARVDLVADGDSVQMDGRVPDLPASFQAQLQIDAPRSFTAELSLDNAGLARFSRPVGPAGEMLTIDGSLSLQATGSGQIDDLHGLIADLDLRLTDVAVNGAPVRLERPARLRYSRGEIVADDFELRTGETSLSARGRFGASAAGRDGLRVALKGSLSDLVPFARMAPGLDEVQATGAIDLQAHALGTLEAPQIDANLSVASASFISGALPPISDVALQATYTGGLLDLHDLRAAWQGATLSASGQLPATVLGEILPKAYRQTLPSQPDRARATLRVDSITQSALLPFVEEGVASELAGRVDLVAIVSARSLDIDGVEADVTLDRAELELAGVPLNQSQPTRLHLAGGRLDVVEWTWGGAGNRINLAGNARLSGKTPTLDLGLTGALDLRMLGAFSPDFATEGLATIDLKIGGDTAQPLVDGMISVQNGGFAARDPRVAVTDLHGDVLFARDELQLRNITANANGGTLEMTGEIQHAQLQPTGGSIVFKGRGLAFELPEHLRSEVDADLRLALSREALSLNGAITILRGAYREPVSLTTQLLTGVETRTVTPAASAESGLIDRIALNIDVKSAEDIIIDNNYGRLDLASNLRIVGTIGQPVLTGRLTLQEGGDVFLGGRTYELVRGTIDFTNATRTEPNVDLALETRVQRYDVTLEVSGTPDAIEANLRSPGLSQADVVSLLLTGQLADETTLAQTQIARSQLLMLLSGELLSFAGRAVGLDAVQVGQGLGGAASDFDLLATDTDPSARLTISKNLSRNVELVFSQSLRESGDVTWIAIHRPVRNIEVRGATQDDGSRSYEFRHELSFGGAGGDTERQPRIERTRERIAAVRILGEPGFDHAEIMSRLRQQPGERVDFYRWQQDRDRLQFFYRERDYLEARISARRTPGDEAGGGTILEYEIQRGPQTRLTIDGHPLDGDLLERMKDTWVWAVFDGFLLDDLESMARAELIEDGYIQAAVDAEVQSAPESSIKEIVVRISPGTRYTERRLSFSGQTSFSAESLEEAARARNLDITLWQSPEDLATALEEFYKSQGYLEAQVSVDTPIFNGAAATLPVRVEEGRQFTIASLAVRGVETKSEADVSAAFGVVTGEPYIPGALDPARREVEIYYLRDGYNDVSVAVTTLVNEDAGQVNVVLNIAEGRREVLSEIEVSGAEITRRGVIDRALDLQPGEPANLTDVYRAEKRLYDTGVFRTADIALLPIEEAKTESVEPVRAVVTLQELSPYRFRYGFRVNDAIEPAEAGRAVRPALVVDLLRRNLFGTAISTGVAGQIEADRRLARGLVGLPHLFGLPVTTNLFLTASRQDFTPAGSTPFVEDESGVTAEQRFRPSPRMAVTYGYNYSRTHVFEPAPLPGFPSLDLQAKVARLTGTYAWDRRDDPFSARTGWLHSSGLELGAKSLGSDLRFIRFLAQQHYFKTLRRSVVLASAVRLGLGRGFDQDLIPSEKFYAGGGTTVRGFAQDGLGELDFFGDPAGGNSMLILNQELRFPMYRWAGGVVFFDAGNVFPNASDISLAHLEAGSGFGLRINSPFALVRVDFGVPLTRRAREPGGRWYFGVGHTF
jgi:outer membrane protein assembly complex protein YaeT